jgi:hypothetical protein
LQRQFKSLIWTVTTPCHCGPAFSPFPSALEGWHLGRPVYPGAQGQKRYCATDAPGPGFEKCAAVRSLTSSKIGIVPFPVLDIEIAGRSVDLNALAPRSGYPPDAHTRDAWGSASSNPLACPPRE